MATRILIVEDELIVAQDLRGSLEALDYEVCGIVDSGEAALEKAEALRPELVLMDIVLAGEMPGTEAAGLIRQRFGTPVVYLTAYTDDETLARAGVTDPSGYIVKPFQDKELRSVVEIALHKARIETERRQAVEALRSSENSFREMAESVRKVFWLFDWTNQKVIYVSPAYEKIWNRPLQDLYERYEEWIASIHPDDREFAAQSFARIAETGGGEAREYRIERPDGSIRWISDEGFAVYDDSGNVYRIAGVATDITAHKLVLEELRNSRDDMESRVEVATAELRAANTNLESEIEERKRAETALQEQLAFERVVAEISGWFIGVRGGKIDARIYDALGRIAAFYDVDGVSFVEFSMDKKAFERRHTWTRDSQTAVRIAETARNTKFPNIIPHLLDKGELVFENVQEHPDWPEELEYLRLVEYQAAAIVAVAVEEESLFDISIASKIQRIWPDDVVSRLRLLGEILAYAVTRKRAEDRAQAEQELLRKMLAVQERDRRTVAHDIHDDLLQCAIAARMQLEAACRAMETQSEAVQRRLGTVHQLLQRASAEGRRIVNEQSSAVIEKEGVVHAIRDLVADEITQDGQKVMFHHDVQFDRLDPRLENTVFRIVQECLNNVRRHSQADHAVVRLVQSDDHLSIQVSDQGVGFDPARVSEQCFGLYGICERARLFGGHATIDSSSGKGTQVTVELPVTLNGEDEKAEDWASRPRTL